mgnify:CR=1 FL=1
MIMVKYSRAQHYCIQKLRFLDLVFSWVLLYSLPLIRGSYELLGLQTVMTPLAHAFVVLGPDGAH